MAMRYNAPLPGGGDPFWPRGPHAMRIGDAERDAAAADLGEHYTAGRLTLDELQERLAAVFEAKTFGQLAGIMSDLPGPGRLPGLATLSKTPAMPGIPGMPWMPLPAPGYGWDAHWTAAGWTRGAPMGSAGTGFQQGRGDRPRARSRSRYAQNQSAPADRASRFAALSLLILAMLIWLFTALLFARHGVPVPHTGGPMIPPGQ
jgi:hypothetical protein